MKLTHGYPFWLINDGLPFHYKKLTHNTTTHVTIIGGGISGALTAFYLTKAGIESILIDGRSIGLGSTCASTCLLQYELDTPLHQLVQRIGEQKANRAYQLCGGAIYKIKSLMDEIGYKEYEVRRSLYFSCRAADKEYMQQEFSSRRKAGFEISLLDGNELEKQFGLKAKYGLLSQLGANINAYSLTHHLLQYCIGKGLKVYDRTFVKNIDYEENGNVITTDDAYTIRTKYIVNATGFEVVNFIPKNIVQFYCSYAIISEHQEEAASLWKDRVMMWNTDDPYLYLRLTKDNRIIIGGHDERFSNKVTREICLSKKAQLLEKDFKKIFPELSIKREFEWCGTFGKTKDSLPYIGAYHRTPHTFYALGFGGNGITFSVIAAEIITALIKGQQHRDAGLFSFER